MCDYFLWIKFYFRSNGGVVCDAGRSSETILSYTFELDELENKRRLWDVFRDRRLELYRSLCLLDGVVLANTLPQKLLGKTNL